jgi:hypothetical protein
MIQPRIIDIELTNLCNQRCSFCLRSTLTRNVGVMDLALFRKVVDELAGFDFPRWGKVVLAGFGEPTLHPGFVEAVAYAGSRHLPLRVYTNGTGLNDEVRRGLLHSGVKSLKLSLNVHGPEMLARVSGAAPSWDLLVHETCLLLRERVLSQTGPEITIQLLYSADLPSRTREQEPPIIDTPEAALEASRFWQSRAREIARETGAALCAEPVSGLDMRAGRTFGLLEDVALKLCPYLPYHTHFDPARDFSSGLDFHGCERHFNNIVVFWDGSCTPCCTDVNCEMYLGNVASSTVGQVFNSPAALRNRAAWQAGRTPGEMCRVCLDGNVKP